MGQNNALAVVQDTVVGEQFLLTQEARHHTVRQAFQKCVMPSSHGGASDGFDLTDDERNCVEEYAMLYAAYARKSQLQFTSLFQEHQRDLYEKAQMEFMRQQARQELKK